MIDFLFLYIKTIYFENPYLSNNLLLSCFIFFVIILVLKFKHYYKASRMGLNNYKIASWWSIIIVLLFYFIFYLLGFLILRLLSIGKQLNLSYLLKKIHDYIIITNTTILLSNLFIIICFIILFILLVQLCGCVVYKYFIQLHFFIVSKLSMDIFEETLYDHIRDFMIIKIYQITNIPNKITRSLYKKFYYFLPIVFVYNILIKLEKFFTEFDKITEYDIACYFYHTQIMETSINIEYSNGHITFKDNLKEALKKLNEL